MKLRRDKSISLSVDILRTIVESGAKRAALTESIACGERSNENPKSKGEIMIVKKYASFLLTLICLLGLGVAANAQIRGETVVKLPFEFVVNGKTFPAGTYTVSRLSDDKFDGVLLSNRESRTSLFVHPMEIEEASANKPEVSFERIGEQYFLARIRTAHDVYNIPVPRPRILEVTARPHDNGSASASSRGN